MYQIENKKFFLKNMLSKKRFQHSLNVARECVKLARLYNEDVEKAEFAGLLHDICKELSDEELKKLVAESGFNVYNEELETRSLWHGIAGAYYVQKNFDIVDVDILNSIRFHTVGRAKMSKLEEIVYLADLISEDRQYKDVTKMRKLVYSNKDKALIESFKFSIESVLKKGGLIPACTIEGYNFYVRLCK